MEPQVIPRSQHTLSRDRIRPEALKVLYRLREAGYHAFLCGGCVRDILLDREPKDFDLATNARPEEIRRLFRNCRIIGRRFRLAHILFGREDYIEVATFRSLTDAPEVPQAGRKLKADSARTADGLIVRDNVFGTPEEDALRRDFTVNALFYDIADFAILDYVNGLADLEARLLRCIGDPRRRYVEDPVRMLRAIRFSASLEFAMESETFAALLECRDYLALASPARLFEEVLKLFACGSIASVFAGLKETGLLGVLFPPLAEWLAEQPEQGDAMTAAAAAWLDALRRDGRAVRPAVQFAIFFGALHEARAAALAARGNAPESNLFHAAVDEHFAALRTRVTVPRALSMHIGLIMAMQPRFADHAPRNVARLTARPCFEDALEYAAFRAHFNGTGFEEVNWWATADIPEPRHPAARHSENAAGADDEEESAAFPADPQARRRRPRRRRRRGPADTPGPPAPGAPPP